MKAVLFDSDGLKLCPKCKRKLSKLFFIKSSNSKSGYSSWCKECAKSCPSRSNISKRKYEKTYKIKNPIKSWVTTTLSGHRYKGYDVRITNSELYNYVNHIKYCELCGKELVWNNKPYTKHNSPSLDRQNNENIITIDNIMILCNKCNTMKQDLPLDELINWCKVILQKQEKYD
jgi:hypothetical protein